MTPNLLLHFDGANGAQPAAAATGQAVTWGAGLAVSTAVTATNFGQSLTGSATGSTAYANIAATGSEFNIAAGSSGSTAGDFTIAFRIYVSSSNAKAADIFDFGSSHIRLILSGSNVLSLYINNTTLVHVGQLPANSAWSSLALNAWNHIEISRVGTSVYIRYRGTGYSVYSGVTSAFTSSTLKLGYTSSSGNGWGTVGALYLDEFALVSGETINSADFTPPTLPYILPGIPAGFKTTAFGTPQRITAGTPVGFKTTAFGVPYGVYDQVASASSLLVSTAFGHPLASRFFTAARQVGYQINNGSTTAFGQPSRVVANTPAGFRTTAFGTPVCDNTRRTGYASGFKSTAFGTPSGHRIVSAITTGFNSTQFGVPHLKFAQTGLAAGFESTAFGVPSGPVRTPIAGYEITAFLKQQCTISVFRSY